jgi:hypothetical protein
MQSAFFVTYLVSMRRETNNMDSDSAYYRSLEPDGEHKATSRYINYRYVRRQEGLNQRLGSATRLPPIREASPDCMRPPGPRKASHSARVDLAASTMMSITDLREVRGDVIGG